MVKDAKFVDIMDRDLTPDIYILLASDILIETMGNDLCYEVPDIFEDGEDGMSDEDYYDPIIIEKLWQERIDKGPNNCFHDHKVMKEFIKNPCTGMEAIANFKAWLIKNGVKKNDILIVKVWW